MYPLQTVYSLQGDGDANRAPAAEPRTRDEAGERTLYVTDLDGTLLPPEGRLGREEREALATLVHGRELLLTYATARSPLLATGRVGTEAWRLPAVVYNGAFSVVPASGQILRGHLLAAEVVTTAIEACRRRGMSPLVFRLDARDDRIQWAEGTETEGTHRFLSDRHGDPRLDPVPSWDLLDHRNVFYTTVIGEEGPILDLAAELEPAVGTVATVNIQQDTYHPQDTWLELTSSRASKAGEVLALKEYLGADRLVCFGDNHNDLSLFSVADEAYAVENAMPRVLQAATAVIGSNVDCGVLHWLAQHAR